MLYNLFEQFREEYDIQKIRFQRVDTDVLSEEDKPIAGLILKIVSIHEHYRNPNPLFSPAVIWTSGEKSFSIEDMSDENISTIKTLDFNKLPIAIRARIEDVLWTVRGSKEYTSAASAVEDYKNLFLLTYDNSHWTTCADMICRALDIAAHLGKKTERYTKVCELIKSSILREDGADPLFLSIVLLEKLVEQKYGVYSDYIESIDKIISHAKLHDNLHKIEEAYKLKRTILQWGKQNTVECDMDLVSYYEQEASSYKKDIQGAFLAVHCLEKAIHIAQQCGRKEKSNELFRMLENIQRDIPSQLQTVSTTLDVKKTYEQTIKRFEGTSFIRDLLTIAQSVVIRSRSDLEKQVFEERNLSGLLGFVTSKHMDERGHTIFTLPPLTDKSNPDLLEQHIFHHLNSLEDLSGQTTLRWSIQELCRKHTFSEDDIQFLFSDNCIIPQSRSNIITFGMNLALHGKTYEALHILAPQAECIFRYIAESNGGIVYTLDDGNVTNAKVLSSVFNLPELVDCYDPDYLFTFRGLMNERAGANLRNLVAHGLLEPGTGNSGVALFFCLALFKICVLSSPHFYQKLEEEDARQSSNSEA